MFSRTNLTFPQDRMVIGETLSAPPIRLLFPSETSIPSPEYFLKGNFSDTVQMDPDKNSDEPLEVHTCQICEFKIVTFHQNLTWARKVIKRDYRCQSCSKIGCPKCISQGKCHNCQA